jgi:putative heme-binding domain-containing protein
VTTNDRHGQSGMSLPSTSGIPGLFQVFKQTIIDPMNRPLAFRSDVLACAMAVSSLLAQFVYSAERSPADPAGIAARTPWKTSRIVGSPEPASPYRTVPAFRNLKFDQPTALAIAPGSRRWFLTELTGMVYSFPDDPECKRTDVHVFLDLPKHVKDTQHIYGLTFHPDFERNRYVYICYLVGKGFAGDCRVSRFRVSDEDPPRCDPATEQLLLKWPTGGHNGGCLEFGQDGFLYISTGDGAAPSPPDPGNTGQDISDLLSSILRIDVNRTGNGTPYAIPPDNPFVNQKNARPEVWAYGLRNPWKMTFDSEKGDLWVGDVGWELWEMVFQVRGGDNCGWSAVEGGQPIRLDLQPGPTPIQPPIIVHPRSEARSVTGGYVYRGKAVPDLYGTYVYGDFVTGKIWGLRYDGKHVVWKQELVDTSFQIITFAEDHDRELYIVDYNGTIHRLLPNPISQANRDFPRRLSETGLFASLRDFKPAPGVFPYSVNAEAWTDGASAKRLLAVPTTEHVTIYREDNLLLGEHKGAWNFPDDTVFVKTLFLDLVSDGTTSTTVPQPVETQILHWDRKDWRGYSYAWNDDRTDAILAPAQGAERVFRVIDRNAPGGSRQQTWQFYSRNDCMVCHTPQAGSLLGYNVKQLMRDSSDAVAVTRQIDTLSHIGLIPAAIDVHQKPMVNPYDDRFPLHERARSYLDVNCSHCHGHGGGATSQIRLLSHLSLEKTGLINGPLTQGEFGIHGARVTVPGDPYRSVLYYRMAKLGPGRMPRIGSRNIDRKGLALIRDWIVAMPSQQQQDRGSSVEGQTVAELRSRQLSTLKEQQAERSDQMQIVDQFLQTPSGSLILTSAICDDVFSPHVRDAIIARAMNVSNPQIRDIFEPFVPEELRRKPAEIVPAHVLSLNGSADIGEKMFFHDLRLQCRNCHQIGDRGKAIGPNLKEIGRKYERPELLTTILKPSEKIDLEYVPFLLVMKSGAVHSGLIVERKDEVVVLKDSQGQLIRVPEKDVEELASQNVSIMPEGALRDLSPQEAADLLAFLCSLR